MLKFTKHFWSYLTFNNLFATRDILILVDGQTNFKFHGFLKREKFKMLTTSFSPFLNIENVEGKKQVLEWYWGGKDIHVFFKGYLPNHKDDILNHGIFMLLNHIPKHKLLNPLVYSYNSCCLRIVYNIVTG